MKSKTRMVKTMIVKRKEDEALEESSVITSYNTRRCFMHHLFRYAEKRKQIKELLL